MGVGLQGDSGQLQFQLLYTFWFQRQQLGGGAGHPHPVTVTRELGHSQFCQHIGSTRTEGSVPHQLGRDLAYAEAGDTVREGPHLARTGASQGFPRAVASVGLFSRGTTRFSGSLSCGAREVRSPCTTLRWGRAPGKPSLAGACWAKDSAKRRRQWHPTPVFLPGESQGRGSLVGCCLWGRTESDTTEVT